jgi:elongation factor Ts
LEITASIVKELREKTGVGMMDCKAALKETMVIWKRRLNTSEKGHRNSHEKGGQVNLRGSGSVIYPCRGKIGVLWRSTVRPISPERALILPSL